MCKRKRCKVIIYIFSSPHIWINNSMGICSHTYTHVLSHFSTVDHVTRVLLVLKRTATSVVDPPPQLQWRLQPSERFCAQNYPRMQPDTSATSLLTVRTEPGSVSLWLTCILQTVPGLWPVPPGMDLEHKRAFGASVLLTCVIICSNVPHPVGAYQYNNRYAGWVN